MDWTLMIVVFTVAIALIFDVINGFHDSANSIATVVSTRVLTPGVAVWWAAFFNFAAMFIFAPKVANTVSKIVKIDPLDPVFIYVVLAGLIGAIVWDLMTWWWGLPTSSSHALIGGFAGAGVAYAGWDIINWEKIWVTVKFIPLAPLIGLVLGMFLMFTVIWIFHKWRPYTLDKLFRKGQLVSAALYSLGHGGNDAQKTMGIIMALLFAAGMMPADEQLSLTDMKTSWIIVSCHLAMGLGTAFGGWRIVKTMGMKITKLKPIGGFCAETSGAFTLFFATHLGVPVSTTHTITGSIIGVGAVNKLSGIKWGVAQRILWAWVVTIPFSAFVSALCFEAGRLLHDFLA
ncbi:MAG: inorganic phosphate transporter [Desulfobacteraceae bacterium]|nr:inorganic phosphate transporter [Desulfobacteraceae bacterium]MBU4001911.1 inorganic phosphate transporter [Pseudomonadota bacterium]MBU4054123.1 inorganic phosphate transporter [Pseudomonadota bacterium]